MTSEGRLQSFRKGLDSRLVNIEAYYMRPFNIGNSNTTYVSTLIVPEFDVTRATRHRREEGASFLLDGVARPMVALRHVGHACMRLSNTACTL
jgi:hypothetical protein